VRPAPELQLVSDHTALWHAFDPTVKTELFSTSIFSSSGIILVDPIPLDPLALNQLQSRSPVQAIIVTNQNHWRTAADFAAQLSVQIFAHPAAELPDRPQPFQAVGDGHRLDNNLEVVAIEGAVPGEIALFCEIDGGNLILGDALINFEPYGFTFLPPKYCEDQRKMKKSLHRLMDFPIKRMFFAHGLPILVRAETKLRDLLNEE
jgi:hypothetical protein